jgi:hypothetical protein
MYRIYCKNCKYFFKGEPGHLPAQCSGIFKNIKDDVTGLQYKDLNYEEIYNYNINNRNNNCKYYIRKWYKFWV